MSLTERLDHFQRNHPGAGFTLAVIYKFGDDYGTYLAALLTYYGFISFFPLLLLFSTVLGFLLGGNPELQHQLLDSALQQFPVIGPQLSTPESLGGGVTGLVVGTLVTLYGGLGIAQAVQYAMNTAWSVPRHRRPNPFLARGRSLALLSTGGLAVLGTSVLSAIGSSGSAFGVNFGIGFHVLLIGLSMLVNAVVFVLVFRLATPRRLSVRQVAPGALVAAVAWQLLQTFGGRYVGHVVKNASATNAVFALVLGLLAFFYLAAIVFVLCIEINVVRVDRLYPRALLTPFTDDVVLTPGDEKVYADAARSQTAKGFEHVEVSFDRPDERDGPVVRHAADMSEADPQPRDIALEQETPEQAADLEAQSDPRPDPGTDDPAELSEGRS
jgi:membrane protein